MHPFLLKAEGWRRGRGDLNHVAAADSTDRRLLIFGSKDSNISNRAKPVRFTQLFENVRAEATHKTYETRTRALHQACRAEWETQATHRTAGNRPQFEGFNKECVGVHANLGYPGARVHGQFRSLCHRPLDPCYLGPLDPWILGHLVAFVR